MLKKNYDDDLMDTLNDLIIYSRCPKCGGSCDYHTGTCEYCGSFNQDLKTAYDEVISIISLLDKDNISKSLILQIYDFIKNSDISYDFLEKFNILEKTKEIIKDLEYATNYSNEDEKLLEYIFTYDSFLDINMVLRDLIIRNVILKHNTLNEHLIEKVLRHLVISSTRKYNEGLEFYLKKLGNGVSGETIRYYVFLSEEKFNEFYNEGNVNIFFTLAHEIRHTYQKYCRERNIINSYIELLALKEGLLRAYNNDIYSNAKNYVKNLYEIDANIYSYNAASNYLESLGFNVSLDVDTMIDREMKRSEDCYREVDGELVNFNDLFADYIKDNPALFNRFPQLHYEFKEEDGRIVYKSKNELIDGFYCSDEGLEELYLNLINNAKERENIKKDEIKK